MRRAACLPCSKPARCVIKRRLSLADPTAVDLTNCDREPIHILGAVQPIGFLLAFSGQWLAERASANLGDFLGVSAQDAIGRTLAELLSEEAAHTIRNRIAMLSGEDAVERIFGCVLRP